MPAEAELTQAMVKIKVSQSTWSLYWCISSSGPSLQIELSGTVNLREWPRGKHVLKKMKG